MSWHRVTAGTELTPQRRKGISPRLGTAAWRCTSRRNIQHNRGVPQSMLGDGTAKRLCELHGKGQSIWGIARAWMRSSSPCYHSC